MFTARTLLVLLALVWLGSISTTSAQPESEVFLPVDQAVGDLDRRSTSLRHIEQGIGVFGQAGALYRRQGLDPWSAGNGQPLAQQYQFRQPGFTAWIDQPEYLVLDEFGEMRTNASPSQDGQFLGLIPPNTVFDLTPPTVGGWSPQDRAADVGWRDTRISPRIEGRIGTRLSGDGSSQVSNPPGWSFPPPPKAYHVPTTQPDTESLPVRPSDRSVESSEDELSKAEPTSDENQVDEPAVRDESP